MRNLISVFDNLIDSATTEEKRKLLRSIIEQVTWDGRNLTIDIFGANSKKKAN